MSQGTSGSGAARADGWRPSALSAAPVRWLPEAVALGLILSLQGVLFARGLSAAAGFDEGVYLGSLDALRAGQQLGTDIFAAQPPGFYLVLGGAAAVFGNSIEGVRTGVLVLGLLGSMGAYVALRVTVGVAAGLLGAALLAVAPPIPLYGTRVLSDLPALDILLLALAAAALAGTTRGTRHAWAVGAGALYVAACSVKLSAVIAAPVVVLLLVRGGSRGNLAGALVGAATALAAVLLSNLHALPELRESVIEYHQQLRDVSSLSGAPSLIRQAIEPGAAFTWVLVLAAILAVVHTLRDRRVRVSPFVVLAGCGAALVLWHRPLFEHHVVAASVGLAVCAAEPIGRELGRATGARLVALSVLVGALVLAAYVQGTRRAMAELPRQDPRVIADAALLADRTRPGDFVVSDQPILAYRARRLMPGNVIDTSATRFAVGLITDRAVLDAVDFECAQAVVAGRAFTQRPSLLRAFARRFAVAERRPLETLYLDRRLPCRGDRAAARRPADSP